VCPESEFEHVDDDLRDDMVGFILRQVDSRGGGIILFHDIHAYTASQLGGIIDRLEDAGYTFTSVDDADVFPALNSVARIDAAKLEPDVTRALPWHPRLSRSRERAARGGNSIMHGRLPDALRVEVRDGRDPSGGTFGGTST
jgi:dienelactone hydrolase